MKTTGVIVAVRLPLMLADCCEASAIKATEVATLSSVIFPRSTIDLARDARLDSLE